MPNSALLGAGSQLPGWIWSKQLKDSCFGSSLTQSQTTTIFPPFRKIKTWYKEHTPDKWKLVHLKLLRREASLSGRETESRSLTGLLKLFVWIQSRGHKKHSQIQKWRHYDPHSSSGWTRKHFPAAGYRSIKSFFLVFSVSAVYPHP